MKSIILLLALLLPALASATTHYVTSSGGGTNDGSTWSNAFAGIPGTLVRGDTYVIAGGSYGPYTFNTADSGTTTITVRKAQAGTLNGVVYNDDLVAGWSSAFQTTQAVWTATGQSAWTITTDFWNFDGVQPGIKWSTTNLGFKLQQGAPNQQTHLADIGQWPTANHGNSVSIKNTMFQCPGQGFDQEQFDVVFSGAVSGDYLGFNYFAPGAQQHVRIFGTQGATIEFNFIAGISYFSDHHGENIGLLLEQVSSGQQPANTTIRYNWFDDSATSNTTGQIIDLTNTGDTDNGVFVYSNVFFNLQGHNGIGSGNSGSPGALTNWKFYNNDFINSLLNFSCLGTASEFRNNLVYGTTAIPDGTGNCPSGGPATLSNNYYNNSTNSLGSGSGDLTSSQATSALFVNFAGSNYNLLSTATARNLGFTLASPYNVDANGVTRVAGSWDDGALQFVSGGSATVVAVTNDGSGSSHTGTSMTTALSYPNPAGCVTNTSTSNICYVGSTLTVTGSLCTNAAPCTWTLADQNGDSIAASTPVGLYPSVALLDNYVSGITATGSAGQTCTLSSFNNGGTGATATVALTGTNAIASGALLTITNPGSGFTLAPTTATAGNGTATCSGTATVQTVIPSPATPLGQIDCSTSTAKTVCNYNAPVDYPSTQLVTITATDGTTIATATAAFNYPNNLNEWFTHRGRTLYACPFGNCVALTGSAPNQIGVTINNIPWSIYSKATTPVTYQPLQVTFLNTLTGNTEASILTLTSDPTVLTTGGGPLMPITSGSSINRPGMSYNGKWNLWATSTPHIGGGATGTLTYAQQTNGSATQILSNTCKAVGYSVMVEKNQPGWLLTNDATNLNVCNLDNAQTVTNIIPHGMGTRGSGDPEGFSYEGGTSDSLYPLRQINNATCTPILQSCSVNVATFDVSNCYISLTTNCAAQSGTTWNSFIQNTGMTYGWNEQGTIHCSPPVETPAPACEFHYHDIWFVPRSNIIASLYGSFSNAGESIYYQQPLGGGTLDASSCATPSAWGTGTTATCLAPNVATNTPFWGHPAFNHAVNYLVAYSGRQFCGSTASNQCNNNTNGNGVTDMRSNTSVFFSSAEVVGHSCWDGYNTDVFCHDGGFRNTQDIVNGCVNQALRTVTISTSTSTPYGRFGCRPEGSSGTINSYILSPAQSPDATKLLYSSAVSQQNNNTRIALGWMFQTAKPAPPVNVTLNGTSSAQVQWTAAALNREAALYWVYKQPSCTGNWTRLASVAPSNWTTTGFVPSTSNYTDATLTSGQNACYGVTSQEWAGAESAALSNIVKITNTSGTFSFSNFAGPGTIFSIAGPTNASALAISQKLICATNCAAVNTPHAPTTSAGTGTFPAATYFAMIVYGKCVDFPNCSNFKGTLPSVASSGLALTSQGLNVFPNNSEMVGQDAIQVYVNTASTPASAFHLQTPTSCTPTATVINSTIVLLNNFNVAAANQANCLFGTYNATGPAPPTTNTAVGGYQLTWTDAGGPGDRYQQIYYSESGIVPANEAAAQPFLIATPPVGTQSFYDAFANQQVLPANIHYAVVTKRMDGTRSNGVCMTGAGVAEIGSGTSACVPASGTTASLSPNLNFGGQNINTTSPGMATTLTNTGTNPLVVTQAQLFGTNFTLTNLGTCPGTSFTLQPAPAANSCTFIITFTPTAFTSYSGTFQVTDNATGSPQIITLSGNATAPIITWVSPQGGTTYNFGNVATGLSIASNPLTMQNTGTGPLNVSLSITGTNANQFSIQSSSCPGSLPAGNSCTVTVLFSPTLVQSDTASLKETDNVQNISSSLTLNGAGVNPPVQQVAPAPWVLIARRKGR